MKSFWYSILLILHTFIKPSISFFTNSVLLNNNPTKERFLYELHGITKTKTAILDGSSFNAYNAFLSGETGTSTNLSYQNNQHGYCHIVTAQLPTNERIVGIKVDISHNSQSSESHEKVIIDDDVEVYKDSIATIPKSVSDDDAISTCIASLVGIHCVLNDPISPDDKIVKNVAGSSVEFFSDLEISSSSSDHTIRKAVVVGGGGYACFIAQGLAAIGAKVTQVTTNKLATLGIKSNISVSPPQGIGDLDVGFASEIGKFDVLVDTLSDEAKAGESMCLGINNDWDNFNTNTGEECSSAVIMELKRRNNCKRYISTMGKAQQMVRDNGLIFGRGEAIKYSKDVVKNPSKNRAVYIVPPKQFGTKTLQKILDSNVLMKSNSNESWSQGWSMKDYWELTMWPRDVTGAANVRFGFPVVDDLNDNNEKLKMISDPPRAAKTQSLNTLPQDEFAGGKNPYVHTINGIEDLSNDVLGEQKKCVLFLSSPSCRTCKYLTPHFTNLSRRFSDSDSDIVFAKANAFSKRGKELSRVLSVDAVPAFVLFRDGQRFGSTLSISKMPSKKLDLALQLLQNGEWDKKRINKL